MIVLDASVLISYLESDNVQHVAAENLLTVLADDDFGISALTMSEVLVGPTRSDRLAEVRAALAELDIVEQAWPTDCAVALARLRVSTRLKLSDCCVLLAAAAGPFAIATFDDRLASAARSLGFVVFPEPDSATGGGGASSSASQ